jgi:hypothetical protein
VTFEKFRRLCLAMPEAEEVETWGDNTFRIRGRIFAIGSPEGRSVSIKASLDDQSGLIEMDPKAFSAAAYTGRFGWVSVRLAGLGVEMGERLVKNAWEQTAPKRLVNAQLTRRSEPRDVEGEYPVRPRPRRKGRS